MWTFPFTFLHFWLLQRPPTEIRVYVNQLMLPHQWFTSFFQSHPLFVGKAATWLHIVSRSQRRASSSEVTESWRLNRSRTDGEELMFGRLSGGSVRRRQRCFTARQHSRMRIFHVRTAGALHKEGKTQCFTFKYTVKLCESVKDL